MRMLIVGGGTGGHLFPGVAVAEEFLERDPENQVLFVGTASGIEAKILPELQYPYKMIRSEPLVGQGFFARLRGLAILPISGLDALSILRSFVPQIVLGTGGFVSGPMVMAAVYRKIPTAIHEQNTITGATNRILGKRVDKVYLTFETARSQFPVAEENDRILITGNPIRKSILGALEQEAPRETSGSGLRVLIIGGSQGAHRLNQLACAAFGHLSELKGLVKILHQTGDADWYDTATSYARHGFRAKVVTFIDEMAPALLDADLIISRAGAGAIAEITMSGKPSILVPFPFAAGDHQTVNAQALVDAGAAMIVEDQLQSVPKLAGHISRLVKNLELRMDMSRQALALAKPDAARIIVDDFIKLARQARK